ncbi:MAG: alpha/beta hydrolase [Solirubrobacteraceae bacterium]
MSDLDLLEHQLRLAAGEPQGTLVLMHGRGADEFDLLPLLDALDPGRRLVGIVPRAPLALSPGGFHWYVSRRVGYPDRDTFLAAYATLQRFSGALPSALGVPWSRTVIAGFSMGAVMSYALALGSGRPAPAGLLAFSGFIPTVEGFELEWSNLREVPVAIGHGTHDPVIPVQFGREARMALEKAGARVTYRESPMVHAIDPRFVPALQGWLSEVF